MVEWCKPNLGNRSTTSPPSAILGECKNHFNTKVDYNKQSTKATQQLVQNSEVIHDAHRT